MSKINSSGNVMRRSIFRGGYSVVEERFEEIVDYAVQTN